jgi:mRNA-degrading endonuclease toxin of MazEF toxin-antitoxin module
LDGTWRQDYASIPRPFVIVQDDGFQETDSIAVCPLTTDPTEAPLFRVPVEPSDRNGLLLPDARDDLGLPPEQLIQNPSLDRRGL